MTSQRKKMSEMTQSREKKNFLTNEKEKENTLALSLARKLLHVNCTLKSDAIHSHCGFMAKRLPAKIVLFGGKKMGWHARAELFWLSGVTRKS